MTTFLEVSQDTTKSLSERSMAILLHKGYSKDEAILRHAEAFNIDKPESSEYFDSVMSDINGV